MMENEKGFIGGIAGSVVSFAGVSVADLDHWVSIVCGVLGLIITLIFTVIAPAIKSAKSKDSDGGEEITKGEKLGILRKILLFLKKTLKKKEEKEKNNEENRSK